MWLMMLVAVSEYNLCSQRREHSPILCSETCSDINDMIELDGRWCKSLWMYMLYVSPKSNGSTCSPLHSQPAMPHDVRRFPSNRCFNECAMGATWLYGSGGVLLGTRFTFCHRKSSNLLLLIYLALRRRLEALESGRGRVHDY